jgi:hypothetical protein
MYMINSVQLHVATFLFRVVMPYTGVTVYLNTPKYTQIHPNDTQIHHKIVFIVLVKGSI